MVKAFHGVYCGQWVRTHYADKPDKTFFVESFGFIAVASACYTADRRLKWKRDISDYPKELSAERTLDEEPSNVGGFFGINCTGDTAELQHNTLDRLTGRATV
jgi:hypothetical protein